MSHTQLRESDFVQKLVAAITDHAVNPANVEIELTESVTIDNTELIKQKLLAVRGKGIVVTDDSGAGYSSLSTVRQLNVDLLKIDHAFVSGGDSQRDDYSIADMGSS